MSDGKVEYRRDPRTQASTAADRRTDESTQLNRQLPRQFSYYRNVVLHRFVNGFQAFRRVIEVGGKVANGAAEDVAGVGIGLVAQVDRNHRDKRHVGPRVVSFRAKPPWRLV